MISDEQLVQMAAQARQHAYAPYSHFHVGAALVDRQGRCFSGCNVENASYGLTVCAERHAVAAALAAGSREFRTLAVVSEGGVAPCGACRQVLREFGADLRVLLAGTDGKQRESHLAALLPEAFGPESLGSGQK